MADSPNTRRSGDTAPCHVTITKCIGPFMVKSMPGRCLSSVRLPRIRGGGGEGGLGTGPQTIAAPLSRFSVVRRRRAASVTCRDLLPSAEDWAKQRHVPGGAVARRGIDRAGPRPLRLRSTGGGTEGGGHRRGEPHTSCLAPEFSAVSVIQRQMKNGAIKLLLFFKEICGKVFEVECIIHLQFGHFRRLNGMFNLF